MPFTIIANSTTFEPRGAGVSVKNTNTFADPVNEWRFRPGSVKNGVLSAGVTRVIEKNVVSGSETVRKNLIITLGVQTSGTGEFSQAEIDTAISEVSEGLTPAVISRLLQGES